MSGPYRSPADVITEDDRPGWETRSKARVITTETHRVGVEARYQEGRVKTVALAITPGPTGGRSITIPADAIDAVVRALQSVPRTA